jgi:hypothetical protein
LNRRRFSKIKIESRIVSGNESLLKGFYPNLTIYWGTLPIPSKYSEEFDTGANSASINPKFPRKLVILDLKGLTHRGESAFLPPLAKDSSQPQ